MEKNSAFPQSRIILPQIPRKVNLVFCVAQDFLCRIIAHILQFVLRIFAYIVDFCLKDGGIYGKLNMLRLLGRSGDAVTCGGGWL
ncbi:MAG: hypothetical protein LUC21_06840, partial [Oscillospiraceae bacterium]|nr:hypothetical protein [Oscillospiraceae bacterium]